MEKEKENSIKLFEDYKVRTSWDNKKETWYFSVEDIVFVLTESTDTKQYIKKCENETLSLIPTGVQFVPMLK